jgi:DNA-binding response OmpR family regulator
MVRTFGTVLMVSRDDSATNQIADALREHGLFVEVSGSVPLALDRINRRKFEAVVVDSSLEQEAFTFLRGARASPSNRTTVAFALTTGNAATTLALQQGFSFVFERPLTPDSINHTLRVAYGLIVRERRRYFRYPIVVPVVLTKKKTLQIFGRTINISEHGMALSSETKLTAGDEAVADFTLQEPTLQVNAEARVCWNNDRGEAGLSFLFLPFHIASDLQSWLAAKLEESLPEAVAAKFGHVDRS